MPQRHPSPTPPAPTTKWYMAEDHVAVCEFLVRRCTWVMWGRALLLVLGGAPVRAVGGARVPKGAPTMTQSLNVAGEVRYSIALKPRPFQPSLCFQGCLGRLTSACIDVAQLARCLPGDAFAPGGDTFAPGCAPQPCVHTRSAMCAPIWRAQRCGGHVAAAWPPLRRAQFEATAQQPPARHSSGSCACTVSSDMPCAVF
jgi:hypothetical protein